MTSKIYAIHVYMSNIFKKFYKKYYVQTIVNVNHDSV